MTSNDRLPDPSLFRLSRARVSPALPGTGMTTRQPFGLAINLPPLALGMAQDRNPAKNWFRDQAMAAFSPASRRF
jgi:hypothetical protein